MRLPAMIAGFAAGMNEACAGGHGLLQACAAAGSKTSSKFSNEASKMTS